MARVAAPRSELAFPGERGASGRGDPSAPVETRWLAWATYAGIVIMGGLAIGLAWLSVIAAVERDRARTLAEAITTTGNLAHTFAESVVRTIDTLDHAAVGLREEWLAGRPTFDRVIERMQRTTLQDLAPVVSVLDAVGRLRFTTGTTGTLDPNRSCADHAPFQIHRDSPQDDLSIDKPARDCVSDRISVAFSRRITHPDGSFGGVVILAVDPAHLVGLYQDIDIGRDSAIALVGRDRVVRARAAHGKAGTVVTTGHLMPADRPYFSPGAETGNHTVPSAVDGVVRIGAWRQLRSYPMVVLVLLAEEEALAPMQERARFLVVGAAGFTAAIALFGIGLIGLARRQSRTNALLHASESRIRSSFELGLIGMAIIAPDKTWVEVNDPLCRLLGYPRHALLGQPWATFTHPDDLAAELAEFAKIETGASDGYQIAKRFIRSCGAIIFADISVRCLRRRDGRIAYCVTLVRDITEHRRDQEALRETEAALRRAQAIAHIGNWQRTVSDNRVVWSDETCRIFGIPPGQTLNAQEFLARVRIEDRERVDRAWRLALQGAPYDIEYRITVEGMVRWVREVADLDVDTAGVLRRAVGIVQDITAAKDAEQAVAEANQRWEFALEGAGHGVWDWNPTTNRVYYSQLWKAQFGFADDEIGDRVEEWTSRVHPDDLADAMADLRAHLDGRTAVYSNEHRICGKDGHYRWILDRGKLIARDANGQPLRMIGTHTDITERRSAEARLRQLSVAVEQSPVSVVITDTTGLIEYVNPKFVEVTGYHTDEVIGRNPRFLKSGYSTAQDYGTLWRTIASGREWRGEFFNRRKDGSHYWELASISPIKAPDGRITHYLAVKEDITQRKRDEEDTQRAKEEAVAANQTKALFLANMSHELRTPLNAIIGFSEMIRTELFGPINNPRYRSYAADIHQAGCHLLDLINDILDVSAIEAGKTDLNREPISLPELAASVIRLVAQRASAAQVDVIDEIPPGWPPLIADARRTRQIMLNLLHNAIKFTPEGGTIRIATRRTADGGTALSVADTGIGMDEMEVQRALRLFGQVDSVWTRKHHGVGLGLKLVQQIIELHGGTIIIDSRKGYGTTVTVTFPGPAAAASYPVAVDHENM